MLARCVGLSPRAGGLSQQLSEPSCFSRSGIVLRLATPRRSVLGRGLRLANWCEVCASFRMHVHSTVEAADRLAAEPLLLTIGRPGVLSSRSITVGELETLLGLLGPLAERQRTDFERATDIVLIEDGAVIYWPRTGEQFHIADAAYAMTRVQATLA
ncbi:MAG: hypothetical protein K0R61_3487 [Microvirga sp.]|nr:hypothetical protein [Microvirga sp.]